MTTFAPTLHPYLTALSLLGASAANTLHGRLWLSVAESSGEITITAYRRPGMSEQDAVASGSGEGPIIALVAVNDSGLSGSVECTPDAATLLSALSSAAQGVAQCAYAFDDDLLLYEPSLAALLDESDEYAGAPGFTAPLSQAKQDLDAILHARLLSLGVCESEAASAAAVIASPERLRASAVHAALAIIFAREQGRGDPRAEQRHLHHRAEARRVLARVRLRIPRPPLPSLWLDLGAPVVRAS